MKIESRQIDAVESGWSVIADDREHRAGWDFRGIIQDGKLVSLPVEYSRLKTADYTIRSSTGDTLENFVLIERKSMDDIAQSLASGRDRFHDEHQRMKTVKDLGGFCYVIIEGSPCSDYTSGIARSAIISTWRAWQHEFGIEWIWAGSRSMAEEIAFMLLARAERKWIKQTFWRLAS